MTLPDLRPRSVRVLSCVRPVGIFLDLVGPKKMTLTPMTREQFHALKGDKLRDFSLKVLDLAELMLVDGETLTAAATASGMSKQNALHHMNRLTAVLNDQPADWVPLNIWAPKSIAAETRKKVAEAKKALTQKK